LRFEDWEGYYKAILRFMDYDRDLDEQAAHRLSSLLSERQEQLAPLADLKRLLSGKYVFVFGDGPTLKDDIQGFEFRSVRVAADGATSKLLDIGSRPEIIVTDLDGKVEDQVEANSEGTIVIIHAHGDNKELLEEWVPRFEGPILGTTQSNPLEHVHNFGGFTDGDRSVLLCDHFGAVGLILVGFNWDEEDQEYLKTVGQRKLNKLTWGSMIMTQLPRAELHFFEDVVLQLRGEAPSPESTVEGVLRNIMDYALDLPPGGQGS
jgi:uncharacterized Rossmann fold enzyme